MTNLWLVAPNPVVGTTLAAGVSHLSDGPSAIVVGATEAIPGISRTLGLPCPADDQLAEGYAAVIAQRLREEEASVILFASDAQSRLLAGLVAGHLGVTASFVSSLTQDVDHFVIERMVYGGIAVATEQLLGGAVCLVVAPGALVPHLGLPAGSFQMLDADPTIPGVRVIDSLPKIGESVSLTSAKRIVGVGRGLAAEEDLALIRTVADALGAEVACSRPIAEGVKWLPAERYIGVSGVSVKPDLYLAIGISGQVQHMVGVSGAKTIVAINKDKNAPIFTQADIGIVGDLYAVVPALVEALK